MLDRQLWAWSVKKAGSRKPVGSPFQHLMLAYHHKNSDALTCGFKFSGNAENKNRNGQQHRLPKSTSVSPGIDLWLTRQHPVCSDHTAKLLAEMSPCGLCIRSWQRHMSWIGSCQHFHIGRKLTDNESCKCHHTASRVTSHIRTRVAKTGAHHAYQETCDMHGRRQLQTPVPFRTGHNVG